MPQPAPTPQRSSHVPGSYTCSQPYCGAMIAPDKLRCPKCKHWHVPRIGGDNPEDEETILLSDARVSEVKRLSVGFLDDVFGGGVVSSSTSLVAGPPGAGKTTLFLQLCDIFIDHYDGTREVLYIANEQAAHEIKATAQRIQVKHLDKIRIVKAMGGLRSNLSAMIDHFKPCLMILDSLTKLTGDDPNLGLLVCQQLKFLSVKHDAPSFIVNQINKDGEHAGTMKLQHEVDGLFFLEFDSTDGTRYFYSEKNRNGEAPRAVEMLMTPSNAPIPGKLILKPEQQKEIHIRPKAVEESHEDSNEEDSEEDVIDGMGEEDPFN